ncbi:MAG: radical SAM family heme chaperone HemW [Sphingobacteriaceae bacterium]|nr:radical SAM family heme chaperone HemW [Sphingobacteriaceae bacterium]
MTGIYIHIPFCKKACHYCDFHFSTSLKYLDEMVDAICKEIVLKKDRVEGQISSIYFGGGTPSILPYNALQKIFDTIINNFSIASDAEITIETNPDDLTTAKIKEFRLLPINRFSIGVQSFFNEDLIWMNRAHNATEAENSIKRSQDAGFENLSVDLIYGYPLLTNQKLLSNIQTLNNLQIPHISAYSLTVEDKTALASFIKKGVQKPLNEQQSAEQFSLVSETLQRANYHHYEISNYSLPDRYAVHNTNYWRGVSYLGIGPSAHGYDGYNRYINIANNALYLAQMREGKLPESVEELSEFDNFNEYIMTSLRTMWGIDLAFVKTKFSTKIFNQLMQEVSQFVAKEQIELTDKNIILTEKGKLFADDIAASLFVVDKK